MKAKTNDFQDNQLISMLWHKMTISNETPRELAGHLKISYVYFMALSRGERDIEKADRKVFVESAKYLNLPVAQVYLLAGALSPSDFVVESSLNSRIDHIFETMRSDPAWCGFVPSNKEIKLVPQKAKILIGLLYERLAQTSDLTSVVVPSAD